MSRSGSLRADPVGLFKFACPDALLQSAPVSKSAIRRQLRTFASLCSLFLVCSGKNPIKKALSVRGSVGKRLAARCFCTYDEFRFLTDVIPPALSTVRLP